VTAGAIQTGTIRTRIPARLDRLPWTSFHWLTGAGIGGEYPAITRPLTS
jgi:hypothetical protein